MNDDVIIERPKDIEALKVGNEVFRSAYDWELTEKDLEKAARELGETEEVKEKCLRKLKEKLSNDSNVKYRQDDAYLLRFLRVRKYDVKKAYHNIKKFTEHRKQYPNFFTLPAKSVQEMNWSNMSPYADVDGRIILFLNLNRWNPYERTFEEMMQSIFTIYDLATMNPRCQINGILGVWDCEGATIGHISAILRNGQWMSLPAMIQKGYPWRIKKWIVLNANGFVRFLYSIVRPFLERKIRERIIFLGSDINELHQHVNPALLPKRLNGTLEEEQCDITKHVFDNLAYLRYERTFIFD